MHSAAPSAGARRRAPLARRRLAAPALALLLAACGGGEGGDEVWLGLAVPLTDAQGRPDVYGVSSRDGALLAVEELDAEAGHRPIRLRVVDDRGDDSTAITVADSLVADARVVAVAGHVYSSTTRAAGPIYARGLPAVATSATASDLSALGPWSFRVASSDSANAVALAQAARGLGGTVAVLYANDDYGRGLMRNFSASLERLGGRVVQADPYLEGMEDFRPYLERLRRRGATLVFVAGLDAGAARIVPQARALGLEARFMGGDGLEGLAGAGLGFDGILVGVLYHPDASDAARTFAEAYRRRYGREPDSSAALAYDAVRLLARGARAGAATREEMRRYLEGVGREGGSPAYQGVAGPVAFDAQGDPREKQVVVGEIRGGSIVLARAAARP